MNISEQLHNDAEKQLDTIISFANEVEENFRLKRYEDASCTLDELESEVKKAKKLIDQMWE